MAPTRISNFAFLLTCLTASGCASPVITQHEIPVTKVPTIRSAPLALEVGVYFTPELRTFRHRFRGDYLFQGRPIKFFHVGKASVQYFRGVLSQTFRRTVELDRLPPLDPSKRDLAAVVVMGLDPVDATTPEYHGTVRSADYYAMTTLRVKYAFSVVSPDGRVIDKWAVTRAQPKQRNEDLRAASRSSGRYRKVGATFHLAVEKAMREAAAVFIVGFCRSDAIRAWLRQKKIRPRPGERLCD
jgi:hypothetical protein